MRYPKLLSRAVLNDMTLSNRVIMAPLTRARAGADGVPTASMVTYYAQRTSAGLIISEGTVISPDAIGSPLTPGIYTEAQIAGWKRVTDAVHAKGSRIFCQLWHAGRMAHSAVRGGVLPVAPSPIAMYGMKHFTLDGMKDYEVPRALTLAEIRSTIEDYATAARNANRAGFDGVEIQANAYLAGQFLLEESNQRTDDYGGTGANRRRFLLEVVEALRKVWGHERVGVRLYPSIPAPGMMTSDPKALYMALLQALDDLSPGYIHLVRPYPQFPLDDYPRWPTDVLGTYGLLTRSPIIACAGYDAASAEADIQEGRTDFVAFGKPFIANPDLPQRFAAHAPLAEPDQATMYGGGDQGYIDYPALVPALEVA